MRRSPFYAYPSYPFQHPAHTFFAPSADNLYHPHRQHGPFLSNSAPTTAARPVINIPVHDSASPPQSSLRPVNRPPPPTSSPATTRATFPAPLLDPTSAAIKIQSCFRGFCIRRHRPLLHLRSIAGARKQLEELKLELQNPGFADKVRASDKERLRFSESVMAVILRLDTIQGSIPDVRSQRKEATKMAIKLQDAIDGIIMQQDEISDSKLPTDGTLSDDAGMAQQDDSSGCKQTEESLHDSDINMVQELMPTLLEGGQTSVAADVYTTQAAPTILEEGPTSPIGNMAGKFSTALAMDIDKSDMVDEGVTSLPFLEAEDAGPEVIDGGKVVNKFNSPSESGSQDVSAEALDAADHVMYGDETGSYATCAVKGDVNSGIHSGCAETNSNIVPENMQPVAVIEEDICVDDDTVAEHDALADWSLTFMDVGREDVEGFCPGTDDLGAAEKLGHRHYSTDVNAPKLAPDQLCCASTPQDHVQGASTLGDCKLTESNRSCHGMEPHTLCRHGCEEQGDPRSPTVSTVGTSDSMLLQQLSEDCRQLKSLLGKVLAHNKAQSKVICALGDRLEMLEHQQQLNCQNNLRKTCEKRKLKKGSKRSGNVAKQ